MWPCLCLLLSREDSRGMVMEGRDTGQRERFCECVCVCVWHSETEWEREWKNARRSNGEIDRWRNESIEEMMITDHLFLFWNNRSQEDVIKYRVGEGSESSIVETNDQVPIPFWVTTEMVHSYSIFKLFQSLLFYLVSYFSLFLSLSKIFAKFLKNSKQIGILKSSQKFVPLIWNKTEGKVARNFGRTLE